MKNNIIFAKSPLVTEKTLLIYRIVMLIYAIIVFFWALPEQVTETHKLTYIGVDTVIIYYLLMTYYSYKVIYMKISPKEKEKMKKVGDNLALFFSVPFALEGPITVVFWLLIAEEPFYWFVDVTDHLHGGLLITLLIDFVLSTHPLGSKGYMLVMLISVIYMAINCIYSLVDEPVYSFLTWRSWDSAFYLAAILISFSIYYWLMVFIHIKYRRKFIEQINKDEGDVLPVTN